MFGGNVPGLLLSRAACFALSLLDSGSALAETEPPV
jgi:hypothetical protein